MRSTMPTSLLACAVGALSAAACAPGYDVDIEWTVDGREPAAACAALPDGTDVQLTISSRDVASPQGATVVETIITKACADGGAVVVTGAFAEIATELRSDNVTVGMAPTVSVAPGAPDGSGSDAARVDIRVTEGSVRADLTVVGQGCEDTGAGTFVVSLFAVPEPRTLVAVDGATDVEVACEGGAAVFTHGGLLVGGQYVVQASTTIDGVDYGTPSSGKGFVADAASFVTVDLQAR